jgi:hypothetical protein
MRVVLAYHLLPIAKLVVVRSRFWTSGPPDAIDGYVSVAIVGLWLYAHGALALRPSLLFPGVHSAFRVAPDDLADGGQLGEAWKRVRSQQVRLPSSNRFKHAAGH